ncbi:hypothetical protein BwSH20_63570 [Bradyrhizobium ottawaense]|nr:hypothetical protein SG09_08290 [Bradyrhizobium ottawaense]GMO55318.1 hypothetical protein BwSF12_69660 [Bradyrhizobium ottawaense]GMO60787.1 hypothetical protein BwSH17_06240 [Bradyrhizobium ottawaense]GMO82075.1 hypothetical protein BwSF19_35460 [Bradyrhizobium ottawaense]GMP10643.1 hypothetical protein BwSH20_63570 [Bradyrhizobium ottawaense]
MTRWNLARAASQAADQPSRATCALLSKADVYEDTPNSLRNARGPVVRDLRPFADDAVEVAQILMHLLK